MKPLYRLLFLAIGVCLAHACSNNDDSEDYVHYDIVRMFNKTDHTVSIVHKPSCLQMVDSLVLEPQEFYYLSWEVHPNGKESNPGGIYFFDGSKFRSRLVCFDGRYAIEMDAMSRNRRPYDKGNFVKFPYLCTDYTPCFVFSEEDYDYAVAHGTDLGEPAPASAQAASDAETKTYAEAVTAN